MEDTVSHFSVYFEGHVQGVGFRFTTFKLAKGFEVAGFVENLADGFIKALNEEMASFIRDKNQSENSRASEFKGFTIR
jgi:acylphosphatase